MFSQRQMLGNEIFELNEMFKVLKEHFDVISVKGIFVSSYHEYHGPESRSRPPHETRKIIHTDLANSREHGQLPWYVIRTYDILTKSAA